MRRMRAVAVHPKSVEYRHIKSGGKVAVRRCAITLDVVAEGPNPKVLTIVRAGDSLNRTDGRDCTCSVLQQIDGCPTASNVAGRGVYFLQNAKLNLPTHPAPPNERMHPHHFFCINKIHSTYSLPPPPKTLLITPILPLFSSSPLSLSPLPLFFVLLSPVNFSFSPTLYHPRREAPPSLFHP